jgi:ATP-dependent exoDNAse (exonuclease V) beta subunit
MEGDLAGLLHETREYPLRDEVEANTEILSDFIITAAEAIKKYEALCRERHLVDFIGLEQAALRALNESDPSSLHLYLDHGIKHILVDEFQDTNRIQWDILNRLTGSWTPGDGRTVFIVGDPKQSIYAFRNAEVRLFFEARSGIPLAGQGTLPLTSHKLRTNFRSAAKLIEWINDLFGRKIMANPDIDADEVPFSPSEPSERVGCDPSFVKLSIFADEDGEKAKKNEAMWLAGEVGRILHETDNQKTIAVLLFTRNRIETYLKAFKEEGIPVQVKEGLGLAGRPEIMHLTQMARLLVSPHDDLAWASILRSPWSWFDTRILYEAARGTPENWMEKINAVAQVHPEMNLLVISLHKALCRVGRDPLGEVVGRLWKDLGGPKKIASLYGMAGVANCRHFFRLMECAECGIPSETLARFEMQLGSVYEPADPATVTSPVQMMTIHGAKGLEFDVVFLPFMDWKPLTSGPGTIPPYLLERIPGTDGKHVVAAEQNRQSGESSRTFKLLNKLKKNRKYGEAKRWFYVAVTRARTGLFMSGVGKTDGGVISAPGKSVLEWVMDHEGINGLKCSDIASSSVMDVSINPAPAFSPALGQEENDTCSLDLYTIFPEKPPYITKSPSDREDIALEMKEENRICKDDIGIECIRGTVIHRILDTCIKGRALPSLYAVTKALYDEGLPMDIAQNTALKVLEEAGSTLKSSFIAGLTDKIETVSEWMIEDAPEDEQIRSGSVDFAAFDGECWWIVDFKTSKPEGEGQLEEFIAREKKRYSSQIEAYRSMLGNLESVDKSKIHAGIYLTALQEWVEI